MKKLYVSCIGAAFSAAALSVTAADLTSQERSDMRARAENLQAERQRNPSWDGGVRHTSEARGDVQLDRNRGEVKPRSADKVKAKRSHGKRHVKRTSHREAKSQRSR